MPYRIRKIEDGSFLVKIGPSSVCDRDVWFMTEKQLANQDVMMGDAVLAPIEWGNATMCWATFKFCVDLGLEVELVFRNEWY